MSQDQPTQADFFGHPIGLRTLFLTEMWERMSFYGMRALLVLYMTGAVSQLEGGLGFSQIDAQAIYGIYVGMVYFMVVPGGWLADNLLGHQRAVLWGGIVIAMGHFTLALPLQETFFLGLALVVLGTGLLKGNISTIVGELYSGRDEQRDSGFTLFYMSINIGSFLGFLICGYLGEKIGWHWGFGAAGIGMLIGLAIYLAGQKYLPKEHFDVPGKAAAKTDKKPREPMTRQDWLATSALILLIPVLALAIVPNNQIFNAYLVWGDQQFALYWGGEKLPTSWLVSLDAIVSVSFLAIVAGFYRWWKTKWTEPDELTKIIIGSLFSIGGMACLYLAAATTPPGEKIGLFWPVMFHIVNAIGFAHMLPVSLALFARLAPKQINATVIGLYYLSFFAGNSIVGYVGGWFETMPITQFWLMHMGFAATAGAVFLLFKLLLASRLMRDSEPENVALS